MVNQPFVYFFPLNPDFLNEDDQDDGNPLKP